MKLIRKTSLLLLLVMAFNFMFTAHLLAAENPTIAETTEEEEKITVNVKATTKQLVAEANAAIIKANENVQMMMKVVMILVAVCVVLLFVILNLFLKNRDLKAEIHDLQVENIRLEQTIDSGKKSGNFRPLPPKKFTGTKAQEPVVGPVPEEPKEPKAVKVPKKKNAIPQDVIDPEDVIFPGEGNAEKPVRKAKKRRIARPEETAEAKESVKEPVKETEEPVKEAAPEKKKAKKAADPDNGVVMVEL